MKPIGIAIIGYGKIAADQHVPSIEANDRFRLLATSSRSGQGVAQSFTDWRQMIREVEGLEAVAITTPPGPRLEIAAECAAAGLHILLEKPPAATISEAEQLRVLAAQHEVTVFATWHARYTPAVFAAADVLSGQTVTSLRIIWHEDVHKWHPGQQWIWEAGGFGVFDPGINAFSIATKIFPGALFVQSAELSVPGNAQTPIVADLTFSSPQADGPLTASLDWRHTKGEEWTISVTTGEGTTVRLENGGARLLIDGQSQEDGGIGEYPDIYRQFVQLIDERRSLVDVAPFRLVADCLLIGSRRTVDPIYG